MVEEDPSTWETEPPENFLSKHLLYRGINRGIWMYWESLDNIEPNFFKREEIRRNKNLSVDWSKHAKPELTLRRLGNDRREWGIAEINVGDFRCLNEKKILSLSLQHDPQREPDPKGFRNRAHTLILGWNPRSISMIREELSEITQWVPNLKPIKDDNP